MLIDNHLTARQAQKLLHMICYPEGEYYKNEMDQKSLIVRILENLDQWTLRISLLDLQLMAKQTTPNSPEYLNWLDTVARAAIDVFQEPEDSKMSEKQMRSMWLVAPLISKLSKLPIAVQGRILRVAGQVLETTSLFTSRIKIEEDHDHDDEPSEPERKKSPQLNHQPFLGLILTCLKGQDDQKEDLLNSLNSQLSQFVQSKEMENIGGVEDPKGREEMLDALQLRFSLIGGMFDAIQKNTNSTTDWAILLVQLISQGVIDLTNNSELFTTALDMLATLIHSTLVTDSHTERDETKKSYQNLTKKLKKELGDKNSASIKFVRQLLPLSKQTCEVIACEPLGTMTDAKGNKISIDTDKKHGLRLADKQRVSVWDLLEGSKNPAPLSWAWFGAVKMERKPLVYEEAHRLLKYHTHNLVKPARYFYEPLPLPPEDLEPEKPKDEKADTPSSLDQSPAGRGKGKGIRRPRKPKQQPTPPVPSTLQQQLQQPTISQVQQMNQGGQMIQGQQMNLQAAMGVNNMQQPQQQQQQQQAQQQQQQFQMMNQGGGQMMMQNQPGLMQNQMQNQMGQMVGQQMNFQGNQGNMMQGNMQGNMSGPNQQQQQWGGPYQNQMQPGQVQQGQPPFYQGPQQSK